jgi:transposase InsO family protein
VSVPDDDVYNLMVEILSDGQPSVTQDLSIRKAARRRLNTDQYQLRGSNLCLKDGRILPRQETIRDIVVQCHLAMFGAGSAKIVGQLSNKYCGITEKAVQAILNTLAVHTAQRPVFQNKSTLQPVNSKGVMHRHQIDLVKMHEIDGFNNVLSILDVFSRFLWLRPLKTATADEVASEVGRVYRQFGQPQIVQTDNGSEFKGSFATLMSQTGIKHIHGRPYHPQSQGKVSVRSRVLINCKSQIRIG